MRHTSPEIAERIRTAIRGTDPVERLRRALLFSESMRETALAGLRARHPHKSVVELVELMLNEQLPHAKRARNA